MRCIVLWSLLPLCVLSFLSAVHCVAHYNRLNTRASAVAGYATDSAEDAWQPRTTTTHHRNWIILQRTEADRRGAHLYGDTSSSSSGALQLRRPSHMRAQMYDALTQRLPVNYYAYNQSNGNYAHSKLPITDVNKNLNSAVGRDGAEEPFVLAISKFQSRDIDDIADSDTMRTRQNVLPIRKQSKDNSNFINKYKTKRFNNNNNSNNNGKHLQKSQYKQNVNLNMASRTDVLIPQEIDEGIVGSSDEVPNANAVVNDEDDTAAAADNMTNTDVADDTDDDDDDDIQDNDIDEDKQEMHEINEMLLPLQYTLDKVIEFCDVAKRLLSNDDGEEIDENEITAGIAALSAVSSSTTTTLAQSSTTPVDVVEVQGRASLPAHSTAKSSTLTTFGTGRKLKIFKKKLSKLMLPLLIAYKLKFLTLVPVLIGGLTLLVGTTGMAGFFFALFAAVMSLKSGGGKSIVVKKF